MDTCTVSLILQMARGPSFFRVALGGNKAKVHHRRALSDVLIALGLEFSPLPPSPNSLLLSWLLIRVTCLMQILSTITCKRSPRPLAKQEQHHCAAECVLSLSQRLELSTTTFNSDGSWREEELAGSRYVVINIVLR